MASINLGKSLGTQFPADFADAGPVFSLPIDFVPPSTDFNVLAELQNPSINIDGGVPLSKETNGSNFDSTVYATTSQTVNSLADPSLQDTITITFPFPVSNFSVTIFNGLSFPQDFTVSDNLGDIKSVLNLGKIGSSNDQQVVSLPINGVANSVTITALGEVVGGTGTVDPTKWNFSIDNINFNNSPAATQTAQDPGVAILIPLAISGAEVINALYPTLLPSASQEAQTFVEIAVANWYIQYQISNALKDPFDPNYQQAYTPTFVQLPAIQPDSSLTQQTANDANTAFSDLSDAAAYVQAVVVTLNRLDSAMQAGDQASVALQTSDLSTFVTLAGSSLAAAGRDLDTLTFDLDVGVTLPTVTTQEINSFLSNIKTNGFAGLPQQEQDLFNQFGLSSTDQQNIVNEMLSANPANAPTSLVNALLQVETGLLGFASVYDGTAPQADTTIPAIAVEGSMYNAVGSAAETAFIATQFLPGQVTNALKFGLNPQVYACEAVGLAFAFGNENRATTFDTNFGPSNHATPATPAGDAAFAAAAASAIFGSAATTNTPGAILQFVSNWEAFYTAHGVPGISNATATQIDLAARGAAWGDAVGVALANSLGPLPGQVTNFLNDAVQGTAIYSASFSSQPTAAQGTTSAAVSTAADHAQLIGVASHSDHTIV
jgi:hypothetical protein